MQGLFFLFLFSFSSLFALEINVERIHPSDVYLNWQGPSGKHIEYWLYGSNDEESHLLTIVNEPQAVASSFDKYHLTVKNHGLEAFQGDLLSLTEEEYARAAPYIIPEDHLLKIKLDRLFSSFRVTASQKHLKAASFKIITKDHFSSTVIAVHSKIPGYFFKLYTDDQDVGDYLGKLINRIIGAELAQRIINKNGWEGYFKVPKKWLYPLPEVSPSDIPRKHFILIAEDMDICSKDSNYAKWHSKRLPNERLDIFYLFLSEGGFADSALPFNVPFAHDGRWAVIDTEMFNYWPIPYYMLNRFLSSSRQIYWQSLVHRGGP